MSLHDLPSKDRNAYNSLVKHFENKNYKKALKLADHILANNPRNGDTVAMKALVLSTSQPKKMSEAFDLARLAVKYNLKSHITWHVLGLLHKGAEEFPMALKAFKTALKHQPTNAQVLKDTALLQTHLREYSDLVETRRTMLTENPRPSSHWYAFAVAHDLAGNASSAADVLNDFFESVKATDTRSKLEKSEVLLYQCELLYNSKRNEELLKLLEEHNTEILDVFSKLEHKAKALNQLGQIDQSKLVYQELIDFNCDDENYIVAYLDLFDDKNAELERLLSTYSKSIAMNALYLKYSVSNTEKFGEVALKFLKTFPVPSLIPLLSEILNIQPDLWEVLEEQLKTAQTHFENQNKFSKSGWIAYTYGSLLTSFDPSKAEHVADKCAELFQSANEDCPEPWMLKSKIAEKMGNFDEAIKFADKARVLDPGDRFLNHNLVELYLKSDSIENAIEVSKNFCRKPEGSIDEFLKTFTDFQVCFLELMFGHAYLKSQQVDESLWCFQSVLRHFDEYYSEFFDFHLYCVSRGYLRKYVRALKVIPNYKKCEYFISAVVGVVKCYSELRNNPELLSSLKEKVQASIDQAQNNDDGSQQVESVEQSVQTTTSVDQSKNNQSWVGLQLISTKNLTNFFQKHIASSMK
ncbi:hypothetical protein GEMRC1_004646 [Eukaryota sp. GEM-RC1]